MNMIHILWFNFLEFFFKKLYGSDDIVRCVEQIDSGETGSDTGSSGTINTATDDVVENDVIGVDIDAVSTTAPKGLLITLGFSIP